MAEPKRDEGACRSGSALEPGVRRWDRRLWGVLFYGSDRRDKPMLIGAMWHKERRTFEHAYAGEPTRALLFCTRREARAWCKQRQDEWANGDEIVSRWRVRAVPVRETVAVEAPNVRGKPTKEAARP